MTVRNLDKLFKPASIALIGASRKPGTVGAVVARNLFQAGFDGPVMPVNPTERAVEGVLTYKTVDSLPITPDLGVICTAPDTVAATIDALPGVVERLAGRVPVLIEGGIRRGTDILKALGLGAAAVLIGRPALQGLALNGAAGVAHVKVQYIGPAPLVPNDDRYLMASYRPGKDGAPLPGEGGATGSMIAMNGSTPVSGHGAVPFPGELTDGAAAAPKPLPFKTSDAKPVAGDMAPLAMALLRSVSGSNPLPPSAEETKLGAVSASLDTLAEGQVSYVEDMAGRVAGRTDKIAAILKSLGQPVPKSVTTGGVGGPFIPLDPNADPETFRSTVSLITGELDRLSTVRRLAGQLPLTKPVQNEAITSRFGARIDPFFGRPAMHPGTDFAAYVGFPIHATAAGTVITAEPAGGYGNMVEIDHGNGVTTRYGHMSKILVKAGQIVQKGAIIGLAGSTGRSTGPHVHYEVRIDGNAIDPIRYINAGRQLQPLL